MLPTALFVFPKHLFWSSKWNIMVFVFSKWTIKVKKRYLYLLFQEITIKYVSSETKILWNFKKIEKTENTTQFLVICMKIKECTLINKYNRKALTGFHIWAKSLTLTLIFHFCLFEVKIWFGNALFCELMVFIIFQ